MRSFLLTLALCLLAVTPALADSDGSAPRNEPTPACVKRATVYSDEVRRFVNTCDFGPAKATDRSQEFQS